MLWETRKNIDLLADGSIGDPIKSIIVAGGETPLDSDNDGFTTSSVTFCLALFCQTVRLMLLI